VDAPPRFVIQHHHARAAHFDLRLEVDGVLRSWAVPRGPSVVPSVKRLAVQVGDHALAHGAYEGPTVIVWDHGTFRPLGDVPSVAAALDAGHLSFWLDGEKLAGGWTLHRTRVAPPAQWLLVKRRDEHAEPGGEPVVDQPASVLSGRVLEPRG
jgi:DNA ligase D-like protein (predicted 3'-phosphoesterase)